MMLTMLAAAAETERDLLVERAKAERKMLGRPAKATLEQRTSIIQAQSKGASISALARQFNVARATILAIVKLSQHTVVAPTQQSSDATPKARKPTRTAAGKPAAALMADDVVECMTMEQKHGQRRLSAV